MTKTLTQFETIQQQILAMLKTSQKEFNKHPTSWKWCEVENLMLAHQQMSGVNFSSRMGEEMKDAVVNATRITPNQDLPHVIVQTITGQTINEVLGR